jgi:hypothetical protein
MRTKLAQKKNARMDWPKFGDFESDISTHTPGHIYMGMFTLQDVIFWPY